MENKFDKQFNEIDQEVQQESTGTNPGTSNSKRTSTAKLLIEVVEEDEEIIQLFHNDIKDAFARILVEGHHEIWRIRSRQFKQWLVKQFWERYTKAPNTNALNEALLVIESMARFNGEKYTLANRVARAENGTLWYDLTDVGWKAVCITDAGWGITEHPPVLFRRYQHQAAQVEPLPGGDIKRILNYLNISQPEQQLLFLVYLVSCFIPGFPHPIPIIYGVQGSAKSSLSKVMRAVIDPSAIEVSELPKNHIELVQKLSHHWCIVFDNISYISDEVSDLLCRAATGTGFSKRELFTDDEDIILQLKHCVALNGINLMATRPDLLERSVLFELERIPKDKRRREQKMFAELRKDLPQILGGVFDVLSRALGIYPTIELTEYPRMADFAQWGCAIAEAMGHTRDEFLKAYDKNISRQNAEVINENIIAAVLIDFMNDRNEWDGTPKDLYEAVCDVAENSFGIKPDRDKHFPKAANAFMRQLNRLVPTLEEEGLKIHQEKGKERRIFIQNKKVSESIADTAASSQEEDLTSLINF
jgi:hypothetical protein